MLPFLHIESSSDPWLSGSSLITRFKIPSHCFLASRPSLDSSVLEKLCGIEGRAFSLRCLLDLLWWAFLIYICIKSLYCIAETSVVCQLYLSKKQLSCSKKKINKTWSLVKLGLGSSYACLLTSHLISMKLSIPICRMRLIINSPSRVFVRIKKDRRCQSVLKVSDQSKILLFVGRGVSLGLLRDWYHVKGFALGFGCCILVLPHFLFSRILEIGWINRDLGF